MATVPADGSGWRAGWGSGLDGAARVTLILKAFLTSDASDYRSIIQNTILIPFSGAGY
jgi:hypothetical protein